MKDQILKNNGVWNEKVESFCLNYQERFKGGIFTVSPVAATAPLTEWMKPEIIPDNELFIIVSSDLPLVSRQEAMEQGLTKYFTGKPCVNRHLSSRYTKSGICVACQKERSSGQRHKRVQQPCLIVSRQEAMEQGLTKYFTGTSCVNGHVSPRYTKTRECCACRSMYNKLSGNNGPVNDYKKMYSSFTDQELRYIDADLKLSREVAKSTGINIYYQDGIWLKIIDSEDNNG